MKACELGSWWMVDLLLQNGADVDSASSVSSFNGVSDCMIETVLTFSLPVIIDCNFRLREVYIRLGFSKKSPYL